MNNIISLVVQSYKTVPFIWLKFKNPLLNRDKKNIINYTEDEFRWVLDVLSKFGKFDQMCEFIIFELKNKKKLLDLLKYGIDYNKYFIKITESQFSFSLWNVTLIEIMVPYIDIEILEDCIKIAIMEDNLILVTFLREYMNDELFLFACKYNSEIVEIFENKVNEFALEEGFYEACMYENRETMYILKDYVDKCPCGRSIESHLI